MPRLVYSSEKHGQGATIELDSKEVVVCSIAQMGVLVYLHDTRTLLRTILSSIWGARLYNQRDVYKNTRTAQALSELYPDIAEPLRKFNNPALTVFANAIWHCKSASEVCAVLNEAADKLPDLERRPPKGQVQKAYEAETPTVEGVMSAYCALIEKYPIEVMDVSMLPIPKEQMKALLKALYANATMPELQNCIETGFTLLGNFQEGVGPVPSDPRTKFNGKIPAEAELAEMQESTEWLIRSLTETESLRAEWKRFLAGEPKQQ